MKYNEMVFTPEEKEKLREIKTQMIDWIHENIVKELNPDEKIRLDFGGTYRCPRSNSPTEMYHFAVYGKEKEFSCCGSTAYGYVGYGEKFGGISKSFESVYSPYEIFPIMSNWEWIKGKLTSELRCLSKTHFEIKNFTI